MFLLFNLHLILKCEGTTDESKIKRRSIDDCAVIIFEKFITKFQKELKEFKGNITPFKSFSKDLDLLVNFKKDSDSSLLSPEVL